MRKLGRLGSWAYMDCISIVRQLTRTGYVHTRKHLEQPRTPEEMEGLIASIADNRADYPDSDVHLRRGIHKLIAEEYEPLLRLAKSLPGVERAHLTAHSNAGPDAYLHYADGARKGVQITCAGESYDTALQREILSMGKPVFPAQTHTRNETTKEVETKGRMLTSREANTEKLVSDAIEAIAKKEEKYRLGTSYLLVSVRQSELTVAHKWLARIKQKLSKMNSSKYERIYLATQKRCVQCA